MPTTDPALPGFLGPDGGVALVLPRAWLQAQAVQARLNSGSGTGTAATPPAAPAPASTLASTDHAKPWLAHGPLVLQSGWRQRLALVGPLRAGPPRPLPARAHNDPAHFNTSVSHDGLCMLLLAPPGAQPPADAVAWEHWLHTHAPNFRLACPGPRPAVAALWLRSDGLARAALREHGHWSAFSRLHLTGARLQAVPLPWPDSAPTAQVLPPALTEPHLSERSSDVPSNLPADPASDLLAAHEDQADDDRYSPDRRDSRLAAALGPAVLSRLQQSRIAVVGAGRIGSILAHGLARLGVDRLLVIDCDDMEPHNLDGDLPPHLEGRPKVEALSRFLRPLLRPGATVDTRRLTIASPVAGGLLAETDLVIVCVDNDAARLWANAWALASHTNLLVITTGQHTHSSADAANGQRLAAAELRLLPAGTGCLACLGGFAQASALLAQLQSPLPAPTPADVREQRPGSLRSWAGIAANLGLRMVEQLVAGDLDRALFRRLQETPDGGLQVQDSALPPLAPGQRCVFCTPLLGAGLAAVTPQRVQALAQQLTSGKGES